MLSFDLLRRRNRPVTPDGKSFDTGEHRENDPFAKRAWRLPFQSF
jgi:hypothetical protein